MTHFEYTTTFVIVILGLGLTDLLESAYRLTQTRDRVRFHWLPLAWALLVFLFVMIFSWAHFRSGQLPIWRNLFAFIYLLITPIILFLASANALPDEIPDDGVLDLELFYFDRRRSFFLLIAAYMFHTFTLDLLSGVPMGSEQQIFQIPGSLLALLLASSGNRTLHQIVTLVGLTLVVGFIARFALLVG